MNDAASMTAPTAPLRRALVVDDDEIVRRSHARALARQGYFVAAAANGDEALAALRCDRFDVIFSDISMPGISGISLLEEVRHVDSDVPVVMITGAPTIDTAARAMQHGALRYLLKPVELTELVRVADDAVHAHRVALAKRAAVDAAGGVDRLMEDRGELDAAFDRAMGQLTMAFQPIVSISERRVFAYEALMRSKEPSLPHPGAVLDAAERLDRLREVGRTVRARVAQKVASLPDGVLMFVNVDPSELSDPELFDNNPLAPFASRIVLEMTERAALSGIADVRARIDRLKAAGFRIAIDDIGAGYAGLTSFTTFKPDVVKLDMGLVRDSHVQVAKRAVLRGMIAMCNELEITVTAEGIEVPAERDVLVNAGCDLLQGYLFAKPQEQFATPNYGV